MNVSLPDELTSYVDHQADHGRYGSTSEYVRDLIRRDHDRQHLRRLLLDGATSPVGRSRTTPTSNRCAPASAPTPDIVAARRIELRELAAIDVADAIDRDTSESGEPVGLRFIDAVEYAVGRIGRSPHIGSLRLSYELEISPAASLAALPIPVHAVLRRR